MRPYNSLTEHLEGKRDQDGHLRQLVDWNGYLWWYDYSLYITTGNAGTYHRLN